MHVLLESGEAFGETCLVDEARRESTTHATEARKHPKTQHNPIRTPYTNPPPPFTPTIPILHCYLSAIFRSHPLPTVPRTADILIA